MSINAATVSDRKAKPQAVALNGNGKGDAMLGTKLVVCGLSAICALLIMCGPARAQPFEQALEIIGQAVAEQKIPGASMLVMRHGQIIEQRAFGSRELNPNRPFETDTICWIASLTKPITATAVMKLVEQGKLDLDEPVETYLPQFSNLATSDGTKASITIRQLMSHSSGIPASVPLRESYFFSQRWFATKLPDVVDAIAKRPLDFAPGSKTNYSNAAPYVLGRVVEVSSGQAFPTFLQREIFDPLSMKDTGFAIAIDKIPRTAVVYRREGSDLAVYCRYDPTWQVSMTMPDGGLFSTPQDIARFANMFLNGGQGVLRQDSIDTMLTRQSPGNETFGYGLGWILDKPQQFSHWGSSGTLVWADRQRDVVGVFFSQIQDFELLAKLRERVRSAVDDQLAQSSSNNR